MGDMRTSLIGAAGEGYGPESIFQAITDLYADRIGHGFHLFSWDRVKSGKASDTATPVYCVYLS